MADGKAVKSNAHTSTMSSCEEGRLCNRHKVISFPAGILWPSMVGEPTCGTESSGGLAFSSAVCGCSEKKELPNPGTGSFETIEAAQKDPLILAKLQFFATIARTFEPFLKRYQTDEPVMPFLASDLAELMKVI